FLGPIRDQVLAFAGSGATSLQVAVPGRLFARRKNGVEFPAEIYVSKLIEQNRSMFTTIIRDVTDRETMVAVLRPTNQTLDAVVQASPLAILAIDSGRRVIVWNRNAERILGLAAKDVIGQPFAAIEGRLGAEIAGLIRRLRAGEVLRDQEVQHPAGRGTTLD